MHRELLVDSFLALCPRVDCLFPVIICCLKKVNIIINVISTFCLGIFFEVGSVLQSTNCSPKLVAEYLAFWDDFVEKFFCQSGLERLILVISQNKSKVFLLRVW
jgi:hypothetical protein